MVKLFDISDDGFPQITVEARTLLPFKNLLIKGKIGKPNLQLANKEFAYVYWWGKFDSPFSNYDEFTRKVKLKESLGLDKDWTPDKFVIEAVNYFIDMQTTKSMVHLESVEEAVSKLSKYLRNADPDERIDSGPKKGELVHDLNKIKNLSKEFPELLESIQKAKEIVYKELQEDTATRSARKITKYNK